MAAYMVGTSVQFKFVVEAESEADAKQAFEGDQDIAEWYAVATEVITEVNWVSPM